MFVNKRLWPRDYCEHPIIYAKKDEDDYQEARMYNISEGGMYFESPCALTQGLPVYIKMTDFDADTCDLGVSRAYMAQVRWCRKKNDASVYGTGVRYMAKSHLIKKNGGQKTGFSCDLCGGNPRWEIHRTDNSLYLCPDCFKRIGRLTEGKIKESVLRFMIGNVL